MRPKIGTLTVSFANVAAYESFDRDKPFASRQLVHNLNRIWSPEWLDGTQDSPELRRARELRPVVAAADHILDIHSTAQVVAPFWVYPGFARNAAAALAIGAPDIHLVMPKGLNTGTPLIQHGRHGSEEGEGVALVAECGQHFLQASADMAVDVTMRFLAHFGLVDSEAAPARGASSLRAAGNAPDQDRELPLRAAPGRPGDLREGRADRHRRPRRNPRAVRRLHGVHARAHAHRGP